MKRLRSIHVFFLLMLMVAMALPAVAFAQSQPFELLRCDNRGKPVDNTKLLFDDPSAEGRTASFCSEVNPRSSDDNTIRIFSSVLCNYVKIINDVMGRVYCGLQFTLQKYVAMIIAIYLAFFGVQILSGTVQITTKEVFVRLIKIGIVWAFVSNYNYGVNLLFVFFIDFANQSIWWTLSSVSSQETDLLREMKLPEYAQSVSGVVPAYVYLDQLIYDAINNQFISNNQELIGFFLLLGAIYWPIMMLMFSFLLSIFLILIRAFLSFVLCITAITFLITLSPIFFSMILFKSTIQFFETWLKFMISFAMQVLIVFAIVSLWILSLLNFIGFFDQLSNVIFADLGQPSLVSVAQKSESIGVCPYILETRYRNPGDSLPPGKLIGPNVRCAKSSFNPFMRTADGRLTDSAVRDLNSMIRISDVAPPVGAELVGSKPVQNGLGPLVFYIIYHLMLLIMISYAFDALLRQAPMIAQQLAGPQYVPKLGQGFSGLAGVSSRLPGTSRTREPTSGSGMVGNAINGILSGSSDMATQRKSPGSS